MNCSNTLSKFFDNEQELVKRLKYFDPDKQNELNLFQLKIIPKEKVDLKKQEQSKSLDKLKKCIFIFMVFNLVMPKLSASNLLKVQENTKVEIIDYKKVERNQNQYFESYFEGQLNKCRTRIKRVKSDLQKLYLNLDSLSEKIVNCAIEIESSTALIKMVEKKIGKFNDPQVSNINPRKSLILSELRIKNERDQILMQRRQLVVSFFKIIFI